MIFTDSKSSSATYPIWTCTADCGTLSGVGIMVRALMIPFTAQASKVYSYRGIPRYDYDRDIRSPEPALRLSRIRSVGFISHYR